jgi:glycosyltransferase involved in cell wall biosynthesis
VGRLVPIKGLAEAIAALGERGDLELLIAGDGPERPRLEQLAVGTRLRVRFLGPVHGADKEALFAAADALLLPSRPEPSGRTEGAPLVIREAQARGLPVLASRTGGIPELIGDRDRSLLFEPGSADSMRSAVDRLLQQASP